MHVFATVRSLNYQWFLQNIFIAFVYFTFQMRAEPDTKGYSDFVLLVRFHSRVLFGVLSVWCSCGDNQLKMWIFFFTKFPWIFILCLKHVKDLSHSGLLIFFFPVNTIIKIKSDSGTASVALTGFHKVMPTSLLHDLRNQHS